MKFRWAFTVAVIVALISAPASAINEDPVVLAPICIDGNDANLSCGEGDGGGTTSGNGFGSGGTGIHGGWSGRPGNSGGIGGGGYPAGDDSKGRPGYIYFGTSATQQTSVVFKPNVVRGTSAAELNAAMRSGLPDGRAAETYISSKDSHVGHQRDYVKGKRFAATKINAWLTIVTRLPKMHPQDRKKAKRCLVKQFDLTYAFLKKHESHHAKAYKTVPARVKKKLEGKSFETAKELMKAVHDAYQEAVLEVEAEENAWHSTPAGAYPPPLQDC